MVKSTGGTMPRMAFIVFTREAWGCLEGQEIEEDVTPVLLAADKGKPAILQEIKNPEDVNNRSEYYIFFTAREIAGLPGYLVLRLGVAGTEPSVPGVLRLVRASVTGDGEGSAFSLKARVSGLIRADLLYASDGRPATGMFACPAADLFDPVKVDFLMCYPIVTEIPPTFSRHDAQWDEIVIPLDRSSLMEAADTAACFELLSRLDQSFSSSKEYAFLWDESKITTTSLGLISSSLEETGELRFRVRIELADKRGRREIGRDPTSFVPNLQQAMACRNERGDITGGVVSIALERP